MKITRGSPTSPEREAGADAEIAEEADEETASQREPWVRCAACAARIAPERAQIAINGAHEHEFMNPSGLRFVIACFAEAPGCIGDGDSSSVWTWFPGRAWRIALCKGCGAHLGWSFEKAGTTTFFGLISDRIARG